MNLSSLKKNQFLRSLFSPYILVNRFFIRREYEKFYRRYDEMMKLVRSDSLNIELQDFKGVFNVGKESLLAKYILKEGSYEPEIVELVKQYLDPKKDIIDIGANVGFFSVLFAKSVEKGKRVLAVEPTPGALKRLKSNLIQNEVDNVIVHEGLVGSEKATVPFYMVAGKEEYSSMKPIAHKHALDFQSEVVELPCVKLDDLIEEHRMNPSFIKIDVEGAEWEVLKGSEKTLKVHRPVLLSELDERLLKGFGSSCMQVCEFLSSQNYRVRDADGLGPVKPGLTTSIIATPDSA